MRPNGDGPERSQPPLLASTTSRPNAGSRRGRRATVPRRGRCDQPRCRTCAAQCGPSRDRRSLGSRVAVRAPASCSMRFSSSSRSAASDSRLSPARATSPRSLNTRPAERAADPARVVAVLRPPKIAPSTDVPIEIAVSSLRWLYWGFLTLDPVGRALQPVRERLELRGVLLAELRDLAVAVLAQGLGEAGAEVALALAGFRGELQRLRGEELRCRVLVKVCGEGLAPLAIAPRRERSRRDFRVRGAVERRLRGHGLEVRHGGRLGPPGRRCRRRAARARRCVPAVDAGRLLGIVESAAAAMRGR